MDKYIMGIISGTTAWLPTFLWNIPTYKLGISNLRYLDFASVLIYGHFSEYKLEEFFALVVTILWFASLGVIFTYFIGHQFIILKAIGFGTGVWFVSYATTLLFKVPELNDITLGTAFCNLVGSIIFGFTLGLMVRWLKRSKPLSQRQQ